MSGSATGRAGFGQIFRSFSSNSHHYSSQTLETSNSNQQPLTTPPHLGQAPRQFAIMPISATQ